MILKPKTDRQSDTASVGGDQWAETERARSLIRERFERDLATAMAQRILTEINKDPAEVERLVRARADAREGKLHRRA